MKRLWMILSVLGLCLALLSGCARKGVYSQEQGTPGQWYSEQKAHAMHETYLQSLKEMEQPSESTAPTEESLALSKWKLTHAMYDETCVKDILRLADGKCYDFLQLEWWCSESSEERLCILMCFYHRLNPEVSHFPTFRLYSQRFEERERDSRLKEIEFVKTLREIWRLE